MNRLLTILALICLAAAFLAVQPARADVAPPEAPPGSTLWPGSETTQVRMVAETVTLTIAPDKETALARTSAVFTMRNLGAQAERLAVRFPLRFQLYPEERYPEINDLRVKVNGRGVTSRREVITYTQVRDLWSQDTEIPWSVFEVDFPPDEDVTIEVTYTAHGYGYFPWQAFRYILETGAGWKDTIGSADIIVSLPYEANEYNVWLEAQTGFSTTSPGAVFLGDEVRWHFEDFEPDFEDNIEISIVTPSQWQKVLAELDNTVRNPADGEAWGRLGKAYKEIAREGKGYPRTDPTGEELFELSAAAYEKCLSLLPDDSLWHTGYADLLWTHYYFANRSPGSDSTWELLLALTHLEKAVQLDPNNQLARDHLDNISYSMPEAVVKTDTGYILLGLTVTPAPPASIQLPTETPTTQPTGTAEAVTTTTPTLPTEVVTTQTPSAGGPSSLCGGAGLILPLSGAAVWSSRRRRGGR